MDSVEEVKLPEPEDYLKEEVEATRGTGTAKVLTVNKQEVVSPQAVPQIKPRGKWDPKIVYAVVSLIVIINLLILICVRRRMKREQDTQLNMQVQSAVSQYFALSGSEV